MLYILQEGLLGVIRSCMGNVLQEFFRVKRPSFLMMKKRKCLNVVSK